MNQASELSFAQVHVSFKSCDSIILVPRAWAFHCLQIMSKSVQLPFAYNHTYSLSKILHMLRGELSSIECS